MAFAKTSSPLHTLLLAGAWLLTLLAVSGCQQPMNTPVDLIERGEFGKAREQVRQELVENDQDINRLLSQMRVCVLTMDDGYPQGSQALFETIYEVLRTQGINEDKTVSSIVINEDQKIWKGEPYEQALMLAYYAMQQASLGSWDNARAAASNSLFYLRDFDGKQQKQPQQPARKIDTDAVATRMREYEQAQQNGDANTDQQNDAPPAEPEDYGYAPVESDFAMGYLLHAIASQQLGRDREANDFYNRVAEFAPQMKPLLQTFRQGRYNFVLFVSWGLAPQRLGEGLDREKLAYRNRSSSGRQSLTVSVGDQTVSGPVLLDVNTMARNHLWNTLGEFRQVKSATGNVLLVAGAATTAIGADQGSWAAVGAGLGAMAVGAILKAGAHVDIRYLDVLPQRFYAVPLTVEPGQSVRVQIQGMNGTRMVLVDPAASTRPTSAFNSTTFRYVRLCSVSQPPNWAVSGNVFYRNPFTEMHTSSATEPAAFKPYLPYVIGGNNVQIPSNAMLSQAQQHGQLTNMTLAELRDIYQRHHIRFTIEEQYGYPGQHILERGDSLVSPYPGTTGFTRLYGQVHPPYAKH